MKTVAQWGLLLRIWLWVRLTDCVAWMWGTKVRGRNSSNPIYYLSDTDIIRASEPQHPVQGSGGEGRWCTWLVEGEISPAPGRYAMTRWERTDFGRPVASIRFRTATPVAASVCWAAKPQARSRGLISAW
jgi:hypothetical protein